MYAKIVIGIMWCLLIYEIWLGIDIIKEVKKQGLDIFC